MNLVVFSKDRPMQLEAALESFLFFSDFYELYGAERIHIMIPEMDALYEKLKTNVNFNKVNWIEENKRGGFNKVFRELISDIAKSDPQGNTLFLCDDQICTRFYKLAPADLYLKNNAMVLGFSFRLGTNITPIPKLYHNTDNSQIVYWNWAIPTGRNHYHYPFELMHTLYRNNLLTHILSVQTDEIKCPNFYESFGTQYLQHNWRENQPLMAMYKTFNYTVAQDVNRCQNFFENKTNGNENQELEYLKELYQAGWRLDWSNLTNITPDDIFIGNRLWKVYKKHS